MLHPLLQRQLRKAGALPPEPPSAGSYSDLLERVSAAYRESDEYRYTIERALELSSEEMEGLHQKLEKQNRILHQVLTRYVAEDVAREVLADPEHKLKLGGETRLITVVFADIRNYTDFSRLKDARIVINLLNRVFARMVPIVFEERGTLDKFLGDAVMMFFGAPLTDEDDALRAVRTAVRMRDAMLQLRSEDPSLSRIAFGAGVLTGYAVVGNLGAENFMNYTCVGDTPNCAKRLQENAGPDQILICPATYEAVIDDVDASPVAPLTLKGKRAPMAAYDVARLRGSEAPVV